MQTVGVGSLARWTLVAKQPLATIGNHSLMHGQISSPPLANPPPCSGHSPDTRPQVLDPPAPKIPTSPHHDPRIAGLRGQCFVGLVVRGEAAGRYLNSSHVYDLPL